MAAWLALAASAVLGAAGRPPTPPPTATRPAAPPRLVLLLVVDQLRPDELARYASQFTGGFHRLLRAGTVFEHGQQDHAITETAPGHATLLSGRHPAHTGIVTNALGVRDSAAPLLTGLASGASPRRFRGTTLVDWMLARDPGTRVLSVSRKDRGAILPIGRARVPVYWYADGAFTTSRYYADSLPPWVRAYNARRGPARLAGRAWNLLLPAAAYAEPDSAWFENGGVDVTFPHAVPSDPERAAVQLPEYPWMDSLTLDFALTGAAVARLGRRNQADLLAISLSTADAVGHAFGPDSRELHDHLLRLDRWLGGFLDSLATLVPENRTLVVLTSDHGVQSFPEYIREVRHGRAGRTWLGDVAKGAATALGRVYRDDFRLGFDTGLLLADTVALHARGVRVDSLAAALAVEGARRPGVRRTYTPATLTRALAGDRDAALWRHQIPAGFGWLVCATLEPGYAWSSSGSRIADHGSTNPADVEVPIIFLGDGIPAGRVARPVRTVDIAPTLAALLGLTPAEPIDGLAIPEVRRAARRR